MLLVSQPLEHRLGLAECGCLHRHPVAFAHLAAFVHPEECGTQKSAQANLLPVLAGMQASALAWPPSALLELPIVVADYCEQEQAPENQDHHLSEPASA
jgi:hypothetical protein